MLSRQLKSNNTRPFKAMIAIVHWALFAAALVGCGQRSNLTLPTDEEAKNRASLPQIIFNQGSKTTPPAQPSPDTKTNKEPNKTSPGSTSQ